MVAPAFLGHLQGVLADAVRRPEGALYVDGDGRLVDDTLFGEDPAGPLDDEFRRLSIDVGDSVTLTTFPEPSKRRLNSAANRSARSMLSNPSMGT